MRTLSTAMKRAAARMSVPALLLSAGAWAQSDPLVSKTIPLVLSDQAQIWAIAGDGVSFSRIDPFKDPLDIRNGVLPFRAGVRGGAGRGASVLTFFDYAIGDSITVAGVGAADENGKAPYDTLSFFRDKAHNSGLTLGVEFSALAARRDTVVIGGGRAGFAIQKTKPEGLGALAGDSVFFRALPGGEDTTVAAFACALNKTCPVAGLEAAAKIGDPDSVTALAIDSSAADSIWLLIGTQSGLRRGLLNGKSFPAATLPSSKPGAAIRVGSIRADATHHLLWVFSGSEYFFSSDHGRSFHKPSKPAGANTDPAALTGFAQAPDAAFLGDTSFVNFNLDDPGLVLFKNDTLITNKGTGDFADALFDAADGLDIQRGEGRLTTLATAHSGSRTAIAVGTSFKGLFLRKTGGSDTGAWINVNSLKSLKNGLDEVITFPTLFSGTAPDGSPEYVHIGYRLKKNAKVTITVYNYAMEKVKTIVSNAPRLGGGNRSESSAEDRWDGKDRSGRSVSIGTYYILVEASDGEKGWGKAIAVHGRDQ